MLKPWPHIYLFKRKYDWKLTLFSWPFLNNKHKKWPQPISRFCEKGSFIPPFLPWITEVSLPFLLILVSLTRREGARRNSPPRTSKNVCVGELYQTVRTGFSISWRTDLWRRSKISWITLLSWQFAQSCDFRYPIKATQTKQHRGPKAILYHRIYRLEI